MQRLAFILLVLAVALAGCTAKSTHTSSLGPDVPYDTVVPGDWKLVPRVRVTENPRFNGFMTQKDTVYDGMFTGASTADVRLPLVAFFRFEFPKLSVSEIHQEIGKVKILLPKQFSGKDGKVEINHSTFDEKKMLLYIDATMTPDTDVPAAFLVACYFTEEGMLAGIGTASIQDRAAVAQIEKSLKNVSLGKRLRYKK